MHITGLYAALSALLVLVLAARVVRMRQLRQVGLGTGGDSVLARRIRTHANALENIPLALLLLMLLEWNQTAPILLHVFGIVLVISRVMHAIGLSSSAGTSIGRLVGTAGSWLVITAMAILLLWQWLAWQLV